MTVIEDAAYIHFYLSVSEQYKLNGQEPIDFNSFL